MTFLRNVFLAMLFPGTAWTKSKNAYIFVLEEDFLQNRPTLLQIPRCSKETQRNARWVVLEHSTAASIEELLF